MCQYALEQRGKVCGLNEILVSVVQYLQFFTTRREVQSSCIYDK